LIQLIFNLFVFASIAAILWRIRRPPQDDPRLSRGLQLLQTKITVLEDLSDRTEAQVKQLTALLDQKTRMLQNKVIEAEAQILKIDHSMETAGEVLPAAAAAAIPPAEAAERQRTIEYVRAARLANSGVSVDQIVKQSALPREQVELIAKFNRDQLMFDESQLPDWAAREARVHELDFVSGLDKPSPDLGQLARIEQDFRSAVLKARRADEAASQSIMETRMAETIRASIDKSVGTVQPAVLAVKATAQTLKDKIVATAEDMLRAQGQGVPGASQPAKAMGTAPTPAFTLGSGATASPVLKSTATVKKVIFPRIEKPQG
jgi:hypothetical protein